MSVIEAAVANISNEILNGWSSKMTMEALLEALGECEAIRAEMDVITGDISKAVDEFNLKYPDAPLIPIQVGMSGNIYNMRMPVRMVTGLALFNRRALSKLKFSGAEVSPKLKNAEGV